MQKTKYVVRCCVKTAPSALVGRGEVVIDRRSHRGGSHPLFSENKKNIPTLSFPATYWRCPFSWRRGDGVPLTVSACSLPSPRNYVLHFCQLLRGSAVYLPHRCRYDLGLPACAFTGPDKTVERRRKPDKSRPRTAVLCDCAHRQARRKVCSQHGDTRFGTR